jgi:tripartite-type tricarboxylate transporter receptor subunit TctC
MSEPRATARAIIGAIALGAWCTASAQSYPTKPVHWVVPFPAGSGTDVMTRAIAQPLSASLGKPVVVENRAGANTFIGLEAVAKSAPDGYTMVTVVIGSIVFNAFIYRKLPYDPQRDFAPVSLFAKMPLMLIVNPSSSPAKSLKEFVAYAQGRPGKLNYGSSGVGHTFFLVMEMFKQRTQTDIVHVSYKGANFVVQDLLAGRLDVMFNSPVDSLSFVKSGKLKALATTSAQRLASLPDVPTFQESGIPNFEITSWMAAMSPAGTPKEIISRLNREIVNAVASPELSKFYADLGMLPATTTPEEFGRLIQSEYETWGPLIKGLGISAD